MTRLLILAVALVYLAPASLSAEQRPDERLMPITQGLAAQVAKVRESRPESTGGVRTTVVVNTAQQPSGPAPAKKSFWKTPWPYVIIGGAVVIADVIYYKSYKSGGSSSGGY